MQLHNAWGDGLAFFSAWQAWRAAHAEAPDADTAPATFIVVDTALPNAEALTHAALPPALAGLARELATQWPIDGFAPGLHRLRLDEGRVSLWLLPGALGPWLRELDAPLDAIVLSQVPPEVAADPRQGAVRLFKALARLAAPGTTLACDGLAAAASGERSALSQALQTAGFEVHASDDSPVAGLRAHFAPRFQPRTRTATRVAPTTAPASRHALILGGGLGGCAAAWALAEAGWHSTVLDRHDAPAQETSGNPGGLYHGVVNGQDGTHARFNRAAALMLERLLRQWAPDASLGLPAPQGLLRLTSGGEASAMHALLSRLGLPASHVQAVDAQAASALAGVPLAAPAWHYPGGGWLPPAALCRAYLHAAGVRSQWRGGAAVAEVQRRDGAWFALDASGAELARAPVLVVALAGGSWPLLQSICGGPAWPVASVRGQISIVPAPAGRPHTALPLAGAGYTLPLIGSEIVFGATAQPGDADPAVRAADHAHNLAQLQRLLDRADLTEPEHAPWRGRVGWRQVSDDRLPVVGAVPRADQGTVEHPRQVAREPGLFVLSGLGSRGITWSALAAQVLAAQVSGQAVPLENSLVDAIDPARFGCRPARDGR